MSLAEDMYCIDQGARNLDAEISKRIDSRVQTAWMEEEVAVGGECTIRPDPKGEAPYMMGGFKLLRK